MSNLVPLNNDITISINFIELEKDLQRVKKQLLFKRNMGLLGGLLCSTEILFSYDLETAGTNGSWIKINPNYWISLNNEYRISLLAHELMHLALLHPFRLTPDMNQRKHNIAADIVVDNLLVDYGFMIPKDFIWYLMK